MTRIETHLAAIETWLLALQHDGAPVVKECRRQLDLVDAEDVDNQSFKTPTGFLVLPRFRLMPRPDAGRDVLLDIVIAIAGRGSASKPIDADLIGRAITLAAALDDQVFGQTECSFATDVEARPVLSAAIETKGLAVVAVSFRQMLYRVTLPPEALLGVIGLTGAGAPSEGNPTELQIGPDPDLSPEEQQVIEGWDS